MADRDGLGDLPLFDTEVRTRQRICKHRNRGRKTIISILRECILHWPDRFWYLIEDICDQMEYEGSRMFDEYMDRTMLLAMVDKIYDKIDHQEKQDCQKKEQLLYQMILSLLGGEIYHRRCRYRRKRNMFKA